MRLFRYEGEAELLFDGPSQKPAHTVLLPAGRRLQLFYRRTFLSAEQVEVSLLFRLFTGRWFGSAASADEHASYAFAVSAPLLFRFFSSH